MNKLFPYLPIERAKAVIISPNVQKEAIKKLDSLGIDIIFSPKCNKVYPAIQNHGDIIIHMVDFKTAIVEPEVDNKFIYKLIDYSIDIINGNTFLQSNYPNNIAYNIARVGNYAIHKTKHTDLVIKNFLEKSDVEFINVNQGYSKCSTCVVTENSIITSDNSIHNKAIEKGIQSLLIRSGFIDLPGLDYGFIGGASGKISARELLFCGDINYHPDAYRITEFLDRQNINLINLCNSFLFDAGSIIPIS